MAFLKPETRTADRRGHFLLLSPCLVFELAGYFVSRGRQHVLQQGTRWAVKTGVSFCCICCCCCHVDMKLLVPCWFRRIAFWEIRGCVKHSTSTSLHFCVVIQLSLFSSGFVFLSSSIFFLGRSARLGRLGCFWTDVLDVPKGRCEVSALTVI